MKCKFNEVFDNDFFNLFYYSNSFIFDTILYQNKVIFRRILFSNNYINKEYQSTTSFMELEIKRIVSPKWNYMEYIDNKTSLSIEKFLKYFENDLENECNIKIFNPANHGDWPGYHFHKEIFGSKIIVTNPDNEIPENIYGFNKKENNIDKFESYASFLFNEFNFDFEKIIQLKDSCVFIFLYDNASILDWKIFQDKDNKGIEGVDIRLYINQFLHPFPKLELKCKLVTKESIELLSEKKIINDRFNLIHTFQSKIIGEIHTCNVQLYEDGELIDDYSGVPIRKIQVNVNIKRDN